jgi:hypothetical protein
MSKGTLTINFGSFGVLVTAILLMINLLSGASFHEWPIPLFWVLFPLWASWALVIGLFVLILLLKIIAIIIDSI